ncbi:MAG: Lrp/AsnC family transcriptional regulator [Candidatus Gastranaerophilales bacterium]|nr:Lrp/AsnC family transcriptional regulator [Candidatus Gastranaerophilales bacterium]
MQKINLDETSLKILSLLQKNARMSFTEIGQEIGLTSSSVAERVKKMEEQGVIESYTVNVNSEKLGFSITAVMLVSFTGVFAQQEKTIVNELSKFYQVVECIRITGKNDFLIKIMVSSMEEFKIINDEVAKLGQVDTSLVVSTFVNNTTIDLEKMLQNQ